MKKLKKNIIITVMGVDGSGKSTLIKKIIKKQHNKFEVIKYLHLRPYLFLINKININKNPHTKTLLHPILSCLKIYIWLIMYKLFYFFNSFKRSQLIIFDRYAHDLLIDRIRYRHSLSLKLTRKILDYFPEPDLWVFLKAPINILEKRKRELPRKELKSQGKKYIEFAKTRNNVLLLNTRKSINSNVSLIEKRINSISI